MVEEKENNFHKHKLEKKGNSYTKKSTDFAKLPLRAGDKLRILLMKKI